ncbi:MAG: hypothetical protein RBS34_16385 [Desulfofustis sp.]|jgi:hypothetical protein|nr:hypothetical protein [Desulfofustis sp.]
MSAVAKQLDIFGRPDHCRIVKDPEKSGLEDMEYRLLRRYVQKVSAIIEHIDQIGLPQPGEQFRLITRRSFNAIEFVQYVAGRERIEQLNMAIYSINFQAAQMLIDLVRRGKIGHVAIMMSNLRNKAHREKEEIIKQKFTDHPKIDLFFCCSHAKLMACRTEAGNHYVIEGSGNLAYNSRIEQYVIDNDREIYEFSVRWMEEIKAFLAGRPELEIC